MVKAGSSEEFSVLLDCFVMKPSRSFASDNNATVHPEVLEAIRRANQGHVVGYGDDPHTESPVGKLTVETVAHAYHGIGDQHHVQPRVISITQSTEMGTVYKPAEVEALARFAHERKMFLHMDGARISNAVVAQGLTLRQATRDLGVDVLSFGGTKNGLMGVEAVVFFRPELAEDLLFVRKQGMQLASKMRYMSAQMEALLTNDLWRRNAEHANAMAKLLETEIKRSAQVKIVYPVEANGVFAKIPRAAFKKIQDRYF